MRNIGDHFLSSFGVRGDNQFFLDNALKIIATCVLQDFKEQATTHQRNEAKLDIQDLTHEVQILKEDIQCGDRDHTTLQQFREAKINLAKHKKVLKDLMKEPEEDNDVDRFAYIIRKRVFNFGDYFKKIIRMIKNA